VDEENIAFFTLKYIIYKWTVSAAGIPKGCSLRVREDES
jgi:hypothetical protein